MQGPRRAEATGGPVCRLLADACAAQRCASFQAQRGLQGLGLTHFHQRV